MPQRSKQYNGNGLAASLQHDLITRKSRMGEIPDEAWADKGPEGQGDFDPDLTVTPDPTIEEDLLDQAPENWFQHQRRMRLLGEDSIDPDSIPDMSLNPETILIACEEETEESTALAAEATTAWRATKERSRRTVRFPTSAVA